MDKIRVISIDGASGVGKTVQVNMLFNYFKRRKIPVMRNKIENNIKSGLDSISITRNFLKENEKGIIINDGSIAQMIQLEIQSGKNQKNIIRDYSGLIQEYEKLNHEYNIVNILLLANDLEFCKHRIIRKNKIMGIEEGCVDYDFEKESLLSKGLSIFDNQSISRNIKFRSIIVNEEDSMTDIHEEVLGILKTPHSRGVSFI